MAFESANNYTEYQNYKKIKRNLNIFYHNINMAELCAVDLINAIVLHKNETWYHVFCVLLQRLNVKPLYQAFKQNKNIFTFAAKGRKDHEELSHAICNSVENSVWIRLEYSYNPYKIITKSFHFFRLIKRLPLSFVNKFFLMARMVGYSCVIDDLETVLKGISLTGKNYIPFCAPIYHEAILTSFFKQKGAHTYFTFHGVFGRYQHQITNDVVMGENVLSDQILAFGETQRQDLINDFGIEERKIQVAGNPKYPYHPIILKESYKSGLVLGGIGIYDNDLRELLLVLEDVAKKINISFSLKPHPLSNIQKDSIWNDLKYIQLIDKSVTIKSLLQQDTYDFAITHNTSSYYECFIFGLKPFRWAKDENINFEGLDDKFNNSSQLREKLKKASTTPNEILSQEAEILLKRVLGYGINKYNQYINEYME